MKKILILLSVVCCSLSALAFGLEPIDVAENTVKVSAQSEEVFYYGFEAGDDLVFTFNKVSGPALEELQIIELPSSTKFMDYKVKKIKAKTLHISRTGIYRFRLTNPANAVSICKIKIQRIPSVMGRQDFNTSVYWRTVQDTTYVPSAEKTLIRKDTVAQTLMERTTKIPVKSYIYGTSGRELIDFSLPKGTVSWSYYIGVGTKGQKAFSTAKSGFLNSAAAVASTISGYGSMAALALYGVNTFTAIQGEDNVKFWFIGDESNANTFRLGKAFRGFKQGDVLNDAAQMKRPLDGKIYLGLQNDNLLQPINVTVSVTAIVVTEQNAVRNNKFMKITPREEAYLKN
ncbi:hypothetical protein Palpr_2808 [Paludibacter propionicigenes WB4]|uniref:Uncharacterized protein n=1 Tax=Paludibacter propionicigenes (strain DSM 17365 / JCM 13257 / WB4) TaxID=694427 RepID=E4T893_PALPW|nr:hypothetical protein [Paludibacter propionicigenes]ADQ80937.1 hypothetical protein Palpr_2808 [Paludibacter propionicigenes WB4]